ncbi:MAG: carbamate kinase [Actinomycetota bacterium]|jgi:carbamate kinase|nr:carbamate kinase [Actinomycetota bacterium]
MVYMPSVIRRASGPPSPGPGPSRPVAVVAVGGNALTQAHQSGTIEDIVANAAGIAACLAPLVRSGWRIAVVHGNGPQVGNLAIQQDEASHLVPPQPLHELCAMTQGQLGGILVREIDRLCGAGTAVALVTHVGVERDDPAFDHPTKPIGPFFGAQEAASLAADRGWDIVEDAGRGHRRVVASPVPVDIVEIKAIRTLLDAGHVVLAAGGGGIAVSLTADGGLSAMNAVIDKDHAAAALASAIQASDLFLVTGVDAVLLDFGTPHERPVHVLSALEAQEYLAQGQFPAGSMGPKVTAALHFLRDGGRRALITSAERLAAAAAGDVGVGTRIEPAHAAVVSAT